MSATGTVHDSPHDAFRRGALVFVALLAVYCIWLVLPELSRPGIDQLPTGPQGAAQGAKQRNDAIWSAWMALVRGDLWAGSAFTYANLMWAAPDTDNEERAGVERARAQLDIALAYAPHLADAWLMLAGLEARDPSHKSDPAEALKMSYYTGPSERRLIPLRLLIATRLDALDDVEVQQFIRRDLRFLLTQRQTSVVADAYAGASSAGRRLLEQAVGEIDPAYLGVLRAGAQRP